MSSTACTLCRRIRKPQAFRPLYGAMVCRRCRNGFAARRQLAFIFDWVLWNLVSTAALFAGLFLLVSASQDSQADVAIFLVVGVFVVAPLVFFLKDGFSGYSPGKAICGVRVINLATNRPAGFIASAKRNLILFVPAMPFVVAFYLVPGERIGDGWADTRVIWRKYADHPVFTGVETPRCTVCRYDMTGNTTGVCSECGTSVARPAIAA